MRTRLAVLALGLALVVFGTGAMAADETNELDASFTTTQDLTISRTVDLEDREAAELRELVDEKLGDDDNEVESWEVDLYEDWFQDRRRGQTSGDHVLNGEPGTVVAARVSASGMTGDADFESQNFDDDRSTSQNDGEFEDDFDDSGDAITLSIDETVTFQPRSVSIEDTLSYHFTNTTDDGNLDFQAPPGFTITETEGLSATTFAGNQRRQVSGDTSEGTASNIRFRLTTEASSLPTIEDFLGPEATFASSTTTLDFQETLRTAEFTKSYSLSGFDVVGLKALVDDLGNSDGEVTQEEVARVLNDLEDDIIGAQTSLAFVDGNAARLTTFDLQTDELTGDVNTQNQVTVRQTGGISFAINQDDDRSIEREPGLSAEEREEDREEDEDEFVEPFAITIGQSTDDSEVRVSLPENYEFREGATRGLSGTVFSSDYSEVQGTEAASGTVTLFADRLDPDKDDVVYGMSEEDVAVTTASFAGGLGFLGLLAVGFGYSGTSRLGTLIDRFDDGPPPAAGAQATRDEDQDPGREQGEGFDRERAQQPGAHPDAADHDTSKGPDVTFPEQGREN